MTATIDSNAEDAMRDYKADRECGAFVLHPGDSRPLSRFLILFSHASHFYVIARIGMRSQAVGPGHLLSHQAIELALKSIVSLEHLDERGHDLVRIMKRHARMFPGFSAVLGEAHLVAYLTQLSDGYTKYRYVELRSQFDLSEAVDHLDEVFHTLWVIYMTTLKTDGKLYVASDLQPALLAENRFFSATDLTTSPLAMLVPFAF